MEWIWEWVPHLSLHLYENNLSAEFLDSVLRSGWDTRFGQFGHDTFRLTTIPLLLVFGNIFQKVKKKLEDSHIERKHIPVSCLMNLESSGETKKGKRNI